MYGTAGAGSCGARERRGEALPAGWRTGIDLERIDHCDPAEEGCLERAGCQDARDKGECAGEEDGGAAALRLRAAR